MKIKKVWKFLSKYDVIILQETWLEEKNEKQLVNKLSEDYRWEAKSAEKVHNKSRAKGGILVGVSKKLGKGITLKEWKYGIIISKVRIGNTNNNEIVTIYNNVGVKKIKKEMEKIVQQAIDRNKRLVFVGDWNARIGEYQKEIS